MSAGKHGRPCSRQREHGDLSDGLQILEKADFVTGVEKVSEERSVGLVSHDVKPLLARPDSTRVSNQEVLMWASTPSTIRIYERNQLR